MVIKLIRIGEAETVPEAGPAASESDRAMIDRISLVRLFPIWITVPIARTAATGPAMIRVWKNVYARSSANGALPKSEPGCAPIDRWWPVDSVFRSRSLLREGRKVPGLGQGRTTAPPDRGGNDDGGPGSLPEGKLAS